MSISGRHFECGTSVDRHPGRRLGIDVVPGLAPQLPEALIGQSPHALDAANYCSDHVKLLSRHGNAALTSKMERIDQFTEDIELTLRRGSIADPHRRCPAESRKPLSYPFLEAT